MLEIGTSGSAGGVRGDTHVYPTVTMTGSLPTVFILNVIGLLRQHTGVLCCSQGPSFPSNLY